MPFYHAAPMELPVGGLIEIGNFGRYIRNLTPKRHATDGWYVAQELIWERVRLEGFPAKPSRLSAVMAFTDRQQAETFALSRLWRFVVYEIEPVDPEVPTHNGGFNLFDWPPAEQPYFSWAMMQARKYWDGTDVSIEEVIIGGRCRVTQRIA